MNAFNLTYFSVSPRVAQNKTFFIKTLVFADVSTVVRLIRSISSTLKIALSLPFSMS